MQGPLGLHTTAVPATLESPLTFPFVQKWDIGMWRRFDGGG